MSLHVSELRVDDELERLLRKHSDGENDEFKRLVEKDGRFLDPIVYWFHEGVPYIVDGHRRFGLWNAIKDEGNVCEPYTQELRFDSKDEVKTWMIRHQLGRRNLTKVEFDLLVGKLYNQEKVHGEDTAANKISKEFHVSTTTVRRDGKFAKAVEKIAEVAPDIAETILDGDKTLSKKEVEAISDLTPRKMRKEIEHAQKVQESTKKVKNGSETHVGKLVDEIKSGVVGVAVRNIEKIAELNGGKGIVYEHIRKHFNEVLQLLKDMRDGIQ